MAFLRLWFQSQAQEDAIHQGNTNGNGRFRGAGVDWAGSEEPRWSQQRNRSNTSDQLLGRKPAQLLTGLKGDVKEQRERYNNWIGGLSSEDGMALI